LEQHKALGSLLKQLPLKDCLVSILNLLPLKGNNMQNSNSPITLPHNFMGFFRKSKKTSTPEYSKMMQKRIAKRRAKNKVAAKSRRINRMKG
jgi:hypothetical protein